jgi:hypothetical protein
LAIVTARRKPPNPERPAHLGSGEMLGARARASDVAIDPIAGLERLERW